MEGTWTPAAETAMTVDVVHDAAAFREAVWELLLENEAEHNLLIDSVRAAVEQGAAMEWMAVVRDETAVRLIALRRPPYHLVACEPAGPARRRPRRCAGLWRRYFRQPPSPASSPRRDWRSAWQRAWPPASAGSPGARMR